MWGAPQGEAGEQLQRVRLSSGHWCWSEVAHQHRSRPSLSCCGCQHQEHWGHQGCSLRAYSRQHSEDRPQLLLPKACRSSCGCTECYMGWLLRGLPHFPGRFGCWPHTAPVQMLSVPEQAKWKLPRIHPHAQLTYSVTTWVVYADKLGE